MPSTSVKTISLIAQGPCLANRVMYYVCKIARYHIAVHPNLSVRSCYRDISTVDWVDGVSVSVRPNPPAPITKMQTVYHMLVSRTTYSPAQLPLCPGEQAPATAILLWFPPLERNPPPPQLVLSMIWPTPPDFSTALPLLLKVVFVDFTLHPR
jgi:hypothetical protein